MLDASPRSSTLRSVNEAHSMALLKRVSRSFYLSVRILPAPMRRGVCIGYLLARASDTLADTQTDPALLDAFEAGLQSHRGAGILPAADSKMDPGEEALLSQLPGVFQALESLPSAECKLIREVITTILSGQRLDMQRFSGSGAHHIVSLASAEELDDYTWRVAGCVGRFWTRLGFLTLGEEFSQMEPEKLESLGIRFGQGLQLVNILRDTAEDLTQGRNYLPLPSDDGNALRDGGLQPPSPDRDGMAAANRRYALPLIPSHPWEVIQQSRGEWISRARENLDSGLTYAAAMRLKRLHIAVALPARIGLDTLNTLGAAGSAALATRVKIPRHRVWMHFAVACKSSLSPAHG